MIWTIKSDSLQEDKKSSIRVSGITIKYTHIKPIVTESQSSDQQSSKSHVYRKKELKCRINILKHLQTVSGMWNLALNR